MMQGLRELDMFLPTSHCSSLSLDSARHLNCGTRMAGQYKNNSKLSTNSIIIKNMLHNLVQVLLIFCPKVSAEILCINFSHDVPSMVHTNDCWSNGFELGSKGPSKILFNQRPRSLQVRDFWMKRLTARKVFISQLFVRK